MENIEKLIEELQGIYPLNDYGFQRAMQDNLRGFQDLCGEAADALERLRSENERLRAQLAESQRREQAATEDISAVAYHERKMPCIVCTRKNAFGDELRKHCQNCNQFNSHFEWRGPQEAGEGEGE